MYKEIAICVFIVIAIILVDYWTQSCTKESIDEMTSKLENLKISIINKNEEEVLKGIEEIENKWDGIYKKLAYFTEHNELETVQTDLVALEGFIEIRDYPNCISELNKSIFVLEHIAQKYKFSMINVF